VTVNDRIRRAFAELNKRGIVALQNAGMTMSDGWEDANETATSSTRGATFYHRQDLERAMHGEGLLLASCTSSRLNGRCAASPRQHSRNSR